GDRADLGVRRRLEVRFLEDQLPPLAQRVFQDPALDFLLEAAAHHRLGGVPLPEPREAHLAGVLLDRTAFRVGEAFEGDRHFHGLGGDIFGGEAIGNFSHSPTSYLARGRGVNSGLDYLPLTYAAKVRFLPFYGEDSGGGR